MAKPQDEPKPAGKEKEAKGGKEELPEVGHAAIAGCRVSVPLWGSVQARRQPASALAKVIEAVPRVPAEKLAGPATRPGLATTFGEGVLPPEGPLKR